MAQEIRYFKCFLTGCSTLTGFDIKGIRKDNKIICMGCKKEFIVSLLPSCCFTTVQFTLNKSSSGKILSNIQHYKK